MTDPRARICVLGSINTDLIVRSPRLPSPGETLLGGPFITAPGGKGANQAVAGARMGASVTMIGAVGDDSHGRAMLETLGSNGVDTSRVSTKSASPTGVALITVSDGGENTIVVAPGANAAVSSEDAERSRDAIAAADALLMQLEIPVATVLRAAEIARDAGTTVVLNAAPAQRLTRDLLGLLDVLIVNRTEAAIVAGEPAPVEIELDLLGVPTCIVTLGSEGARFLHQRARGRIDAYAVTPTDTVGAGDAFAGAFSVRWAEHKAASALDGAAVSDALCWACAAGAIATTRPGAIPSLPTRAEVMALLKSAPSR